MSETVAETFYKVIRVDLAKLVEGIRFREDWFPSDAFNISLVTIYHHPDLRHPYLMFRYWRNISKQEVADAKPQREGV